MCEDGMYYLIDSIIVVFGVNNVDLYGYRIRSCVNVVYRKDSNRIYSKN